jgi:ferredoxin
MDSLTEREEDMLDLAFGLTFTSRLGCQIHMAADLDGIELKLPGIMQGKSVSL